MNEKELKGLHKHRIKKKQLRRTINSKKQKRDTDWRCEKNGTDVKISVRKFANQRLC